MKLYYRVYGEKGPVIIVLHGILGSSDNWHTIAGTLSKNFTIYALDLRDHGLSPHSGHLDYRVMVEDIQEFMQDHQIEKTNLIGHSLGGKIAMQFAINNPHLTLKLIVVDVGPGPYEGMHIVTMEALANFPIDTIQSRDEADNIMAQIIEKKSVRQFLLKNLQRKDEGGYKWKMNLPALTASFNDITKAIENNTAYLAPALFIKGGRSPHINAKDLLLIEKTFPKAEIITIPDTGHWIQAEKPKEFVDVVLNFLTD